MKKNIVIFSVFLFIAVPVYGYTVKKGDTVSQIAVQHGTTVEKIKTDNNLTDPDVIYPGQKLVVNGEAAFGISLPTVIADFEDSLATRLSSTGTTTLTLVRGTDRQSRALNGTYGFTIDEGSSDAEFFVASCVSVNCTITTRGLDVQDGSTNVSTLQHEHRRGASVKLSNFPQLAYITRILNGQESVPNALYYTTTTSMTSSTQLVHKSYVDALTFAGAPDASLTQKGLGELATGIQLASSTPIGGGDTTAALIPYSLLTTSSPYSGAGNVIPVTQINRKLNDIFIDFTLNKSFSGNNQFSGTTGFSGSVTTTGMFNVTTTPALQFVADQIVLSSSTVSSTVKGGLLVNIIGAATGSTSTIANHLQVNGDIGLTGKVMGIFNGTYIGTSETSDSRMAICTASAETATMFGTVTVWKTGATIASTSYAGNAKTCELGANWSNGTLKAVNQAGQTTCTSPSGATCYFYK